MPFAAVARIVGASAYRVLAVCERYVHIAGGLADYSQVKALAIDWTSRARGHAYVTLAADADERRVVFVTDGRDAQAIEQLAEHLDWRGCAPEQIRPVSIDMSAAWYQGRCRAPAGCASHLRRVPCRRSRQRRSGQDPAQRAARRSRPCCNPQRDALDAAQGRLPLEARRRAALQELISAPKLTLTARAWMYKERLRLALEHRQVKVMRDLLQHWCKCATPPRSSP